MNPSNPELPPKQGIRWWPANVLLVLAAAVTICVRTHANWSYQERNLNTLAVVLGFLLVMLLWWLTCSRARWKLRLGVSAGFMLLLALSVGAFRIRGVSGDLRPILELRWTRSAGAMESSAGATATNGVLSSTSELLISDFPQFLGLDRTAHLDSPALKCDWVANPPRLLWRQPIGAAWSGWAVVGSRAFTQEQRGEEECITCYDARTGHLLWTHGDPAHYNTTIAGEGPRCTPTVVSNRVFSLGATGILNCLDLATGRALWSHSIVEDAKSHLPEWGFAGSPLVFDGIVVVSAGGHDGHSLLAYRADKGEIAWLAGNHSTSYSSPFLTTLSGVRQILSFNARTITAHEAASGHVLWEYPWGVGEPQVAVPLVVATNRVLFSSGYGVGSELLEINLGASGKLAATRVWQSRKMKSKFANLFQRQGFLYGLDDGVLACLDLKDGARRWKEGRYGHGQGLMVRDALLLMAENGELVLLQPTPEASNELHRFRVFKSKTWNPIALAGDLLLVRNDQEAACLQIAIDPTLRVAQETNPSPKP